MNSISARKEKLTRLIAYLESEKGSRIQVIASHQRNVAEAMESAKHIDGIYYASSGSLSIFHDHHVRYRYNLESKITRLSSEIDKIASEVGNMEKAVAKLLLRLKKLQLAETAKTAEIELSEFIARRQSGQVSFGQGGAGRL